MAITNSKAFPLQLDRSIVDMFYNQYIEQPKLWSKIMKKEKAPKGADYTSADLSGIGDLLRETAEGEGVEYAVPYEGNKLARYYKKYTLGFQVTEEMLEDELYDKMKQMSSTLGRAAAFTIESAVWNLFNNATSTTVSTAKDGLALIANNHVTLKGGKTINNLITGDLDTTSLQQAMEYFQLLWGEEDLPIMDTLSMIIVPVTEQWKAAELLKATGRVMDSGDRAGGNYNKGLVAATAANVAPTGINAPNMLNPSMNVVSSWDYMPCRYLTDADGWFALGSKFDGKILFKRDVTMQSADDLGTGNKLYRCSTRFLPFINDYRGICGSAGA